MKNLLLESMLLVSHGERRARRVEFHPETTVIKGQNDTGKSSLIKSIYYALGAEPHGIHKRWRDADVAILLRFSVDDARYSIYRHRNSFTLFNGEDGVVGDYASVTSALGPALARLFDFKLKLPDRKGNFITPPPAYLYLPFYIDQDKGWVAPWNSFRKLEQFPNWRRLVTSYHFGLRPDKWYELDAAVKQEALAAEGPALQISTFEQLLQRTNEQLARVDFDIDVGRFKSEIDLLLVECNNLREEEERFREKATGLGTERIRIDAQIEIVARTHDELSADYKFAADTLDNAVDCPTCGAEYNNSFRERFEIAQDTETCVDLLQSLKRDRADIRRKLDEIRSELASTSERQAKIKEILSRKQGKVKLSDLVKIQGKNELVNHLRAEIETHRARLVEIQITVERLKAEMMVLDDPKRRKSIVNSYAEDLRRNALRLSVSFADERAYSRIDASIEESGSDLPRAVLAYSFAALNSIENNGNATFCPLVIDAPNQQEQDQDNLDRILSFIAQYRPKNHQLVLGLVNDAGMDFGGATIELTDVRRLLNEELYPEISDELRFYEAKNLSI